MADVEQVKKIVPFVTCEIAFGQNLCDLMFGVEVPDLNFRILLNPFKQPIQSNSVHVSHCGTSAYDYHLNHGFIVLKDIQHSTGTRMCSRLMKRDQYWSRSRLMCLVEIWLRVLGGVLCDKFSCNSPRSMALLVWFGGE